MCADIHDAHATGSGTEHRRVFSSVLSGARFEAVAHREREQGKAGMRSGQGGGLWRQNRRLIVQGLSALFFI